MINVYTVHNEKTAPLFAVAFAAGCQGQLRTQDEYYVDNWAGFGSPVTWPGLMETRKCGLDWYYGDHAYFRRHHFYRVTKNAMQHTGTGFLSMTEKIRAEKLLRPSEVKPWRKSGKNIIICAQTDGFHKRMGVADWESEIRQKLALVTDRPIISRTKKTARPLAEDLMDAWCVITHSSNAAVEAVLDGVPVISTADCASSVMGLHDAFNVEYPIYPSGRWEWAAKLAANQWTLEEIRKGLCWDRIK